GLGYSDRSPLPRTSKIFAEELSKLLANARIPPPYILVGHSLGGANIRVFAAKYPSSVAGMVLVDSVHPDQLKRLPAAVSNLQMAQLRQARKFEFEVLFGIARFMRTCGSDPAQITLDCTFESGRAWAEELESFPQSIAQARLTGPFGDLP